MLQKTSSETGGVPDRCPLHCISRTEQCLIFLQSLFHLNALCKRERPRPTFSKEMNHLLATIPYSKGVETSFATTLQK